MDATPTAIHYGRDLLPGALPAGKRWLVVTTPPVEDLARRELLGLTGHVLLAPSMDEDMLQAWQQALPPAEAVLGVGGGVCMDAAKYAAWRRALPLWQAPSILSVDACLTETIAVRRQGRVTYLGEIYPQAVLVDYNLLQGAPPELNRAGAGDILSIHTALWDWQCAAADTGEAFDATIAAESAALLDRLRQAAAEIQAVSEAGLRTLVELFSAEVELCRRAGSSRPEEGSEHFWAYNVEFRHPRSYIHGDLVTLGILLMAALQDNDVEGARSLADRVGIRWRPEQLGLSRADLVDTLVTARDYAIEGSLSYSVLNRAPVPALLAEGLVERVCGNA